MRDIFSFFEADTDGARGRRRDYGAVRIALASPEQIRALSRGEVTRAETINYRTYKPERDGLFCARIFGPTRDFECLCGKYKRIRHRGVVCEKCGVEVIASKVRRERMGHIALAAPVAHVWFLRGVPSRIGAVLDLTARQLDRVLAGAAHVITHVAPEFEAPPAAPRSAKGRRRAGQPASSSSSSRGGAALRRGELVDEDALARLREEYGAEALRAATGGEALLELLSAVDVTALAEALRAQMCAEDASEARRRKAARRLRVVDALRRSGVRPEWMMLRVLPVLPPDLRPLVPLDGGRFATSDLNELYRRVINRNNRLKRLLELNAPEIIVRNEKRMLQEAVDALLDNGRGNHAAAMGGNKRPLKSLSDSLEGKQGRFRQNLLGKRVDYSGRSVIVVGPQLALHQCGLPKTMALELFRPFVYGLLEARGLAPTVRAARKMVERGTREVWDALDEVIREHPVLLNRAPTLHRLGIQAFEPVLVEGKAIQLHPLVCMAFNADFDGDQMAVHVPLSVEAQAEARVLMMSTNNLLSPANGRPVVNPTQDIVLGLYALTRAPARGPGGGERASSSATAASGARAVAGVFGSPAELRAALDRDVVGLRSAVIVRLDAVRVTDAGDAALAAGACVDRAEFDAANRALARRTGEGARAARGEPASRRVETTAGRVVLYDEVCDALRVALGAPAGASLPFALCDREMNRKALAALVAECHRAWGQKATAVLADRLRTLGFEHATRAGLSIAVDDLRVPARKGEIVAAAHARAGEVEKRYLEGTITHDERHNELVDIWVGAADRVAEAMMQEIGAPDARTGAPSDNPVFVMADSGARGSTQQMRQLAGMRGLMARPSGDILETPIVSNFREGLSVLEYFVSTHGARKGQADTSLKTANAGYLTRRLVDVAHDVTVTELDCGALGGRAIARADDEPPGPPTALGSLAGFAERLLGRVAREPVLDPQSGRVLVAAGADLDEDAVRAVDAAGVERVAVRSALRCEARRGVCAACYGRDLARGERVTVGEPVGIVAAQSIGEPGTQLTMRTFHMGGVASRDITGGLPRVAELFEARRPREAAMLAPVDGVVKLGREVRGKRQLFVVPEARAAAAGEAGEAGEARGPRAAELLVPRGRAIVVREGDAVRAGDVLVKGAAVDPHDVLRIHGDDAVAEWLLEEVQRVYRLQGVVIHDKHVEIVVRQMLRRVRVLSAGRTDLIADEQVERARFEQANAAAARRALGELLASGELASAEVLGAARRAAAAAGEAGEAAPERGLAVLSEALGAAEAAARTDARRELVAREAALVRERVRAAFAVAEPVLLGITRASLGSESFFAAASFQQTARVLTDAALGGAVDPLRGLKENLLLGRTIPAGTGLAALRAMEIVVEDDALDAQEPRPAPAVRAAASAT